MQLEIQRMNFSGITERYIARSSNHLSVSLSRKIVVESFCLVGGMRKFRDANRLSLSTKAIHSMPGKKQSTFNDVASETLRPFSDGRKGIRSGKFHSHLNK